jgi:hypothetical protein
MNLAVILGIYFFSMAWLAPGAGGFVGQEPAAQSQSSEQAPPAQSSEPAQAPPAPTGKDAGASDPAKLSPQPHRRHRKQNPNCTNFATAVNPIAGGSGDSANPKATADSSNTSEKTTSASLPPCPPPKKVIHNGGSEEPTIQLIGGTPAEQASNQRSTEQLTAATEENLKKIAERKLTPSQQEMVNQVKQFMEQSKTAVAAGNLERGHNLARKAQLLSEELLKP